MKSHGDQAPDWTAKEPSDLPASGSALKDDSDSFDKEVKEFEDSAVATFRRFNETNEDPCNDEDPRLNRRSSPSRRVLRWMGNITYEVSRAFVFTAAFLPTNDYDRGIGVLSGCLVTPLCDAVDELVNKNQDVRVILRAQHNTLFDENAMIGFSKLFVKHIFLPAIPAILTVYTTNDPIEDFKHSFLHAAEHVALGYGWYTSISCGANRLFPFKRVEATALSPEAQFIQDHVAAPLFGLIQMVLLSEFLRKTGLSIFTWLDDQDLHASLVFGLSFFAYQGWRRYMREYREVQPAVPEFPQSSSGLDSALLAEVKEAKNHALENQEPATLPGGCHVLLRSTAYFVKGIILLAGGEAGNYVYSQMIAGTTHDDTLLERTQRDSFVALGMYATWIGLRATEKIANKCFGFFTRQKNAVVEVEEEEENPDASFGCFSAA